MQTKQTIAQKLWHLGTCDVKYEITMPTANEITSMKVEHQIQEDAISVEIINTVQYSLKFQLLCDNRQTFKKNNKICICSPTVIRILKWFRMGLLSQKKFKKKADN